jgi:hypothetical protein
MEDIAMQTESHRSIEVCEERGITADLGRLHTQLDEATERLRVLDAALDPVQRTPEAAIADNTKRSHGESDLHEVVLTAIDKVDTLIDELRVCRNLLTI